MFHRKICQLLYYIHIHQNMSIIESQYTFHQKHVNLHGNTHFTKNRPTAFRYRSFPIFSRSSFFCCRPPVRHVIPARCASSPEIRPCTGHCMPFPWDPSCFPGFSRFWQYVTTKVTTHLYIEPPFYDLFRKTIWKRQCRQNGLRSSQKNRQASFSEKNGPDFHKNGPATSHRPWKTDRKYPEKRNDGRPGKTPERTAAEDLTSENLMKNNSEQFRKRQAGA